MCSGSSDWPVLRDKDPPRDPIVLRPAVPLLPHRHGCRQRRLLRPLQHDTKRSLRLWVHHHFKSARVRAFVCTECRFAYLLLFPTRFSLFHRFRLCHLCWHSSFSLHLFSFSSSPLTLSISSAVPALMLFQSRSAPSPLSAYFALS